MAAGLAMGAHAAQAAQEPVGHTPDALHGLLAKAIVGQSACPNYPYGSTIIPGTQWAAGLGFTQAQDGATLDVESNWDGISCVRGPDSTDTSDRWGLDFQCTQLAVRAADVEWGEGDQSAWYSAGWNGNAYNMFDVAQSLPRPLTPVANGSGLLPSPGALLVWGATPGDPTGHVAVVERVDKVNQVVWFVSQNSYYAEYGIPYSGTTLDPTSSFGLPLRGWLDAPRPARGVVLRSDGTSGYTLDGWGGVHGFGSAPPVTITGYWANWDIARGLALRPDQQSGYTLDGYGALHSFGGAPALQTGVYWGWDIARGLVLRRDGVSGYVLDGWGGIHAFGGAPPVQGTGYWYRWDIARSIVLRPDQVSGYVLDGWGGIHPFGGAPAVSGFSYWTGWDIARAITLGGDGTNPNLPANSGWVVDGWGGVHPYGGAPVVSFANDPYLPAHDIARGIAYAPLIGTGVVATGAFSPATFAATGPARALVARPAGGGYALDGWGAVTAFGGAPSVNNVTGFWKNWDITRAFGLRADGVSGYVVDAYGGFHEFGGAPAIAAPRYWNGSDMVRGFALRADGASGYVLDRFGNVWAFGGAPTVTPSVTWTDDTARALVLRSDGVSGYVLDKFGGLWPFGGAPALLGPPTWSVDTARAVTLLTDSAGYVLDKEGGVHPFGGAPAVRGAPVWTGNDVARGLVLAPGSSLTSAQGSVLYLDGVIANFGS
ncbi:MAG: CHAP domain-containing protein [Candidatus Dormibacteraeota bacterium]|nr:CHAP domain-containing protein [Candidatus Dormibacteraeota bacterium]MBV9524456.1 CHAP domain-containing protein [Candidatus Dormibacteraeota bacterium]